MDTNTSVEIMLFEGGCLIDALSDKPAAVTLADRIATEDRKALAAGQLSFSLSLDPVEVGMAINALTSGQSSLAQALGEKVRKALAAKLDELGIARNQSESGNAGGGLSDAPAPSPQPSAPAAESPADEQPATDTDAPPADDSADYQPL